MSGQVLLWYRPGHLSVTLGNGMFQYSAPGQTHSGSILEICPPCQYYIPEGQECRLVKMGDSWFIKIFDGMRCRPREFLTRFLTRRLARRYGSRSAASHDAEEIASAVVLDLFQRPPQGFFRSYDLTGQRQLLASRAVQKEIDFRRAVEGRVRCGNCTYHSGTGKSRRCDYHASDHYWAGRSVKASEDPRRFKPPCDKYRSERAAATWDPPEGQDPEKMAGSGPDQEKEYLLKERDEVLLDCLAAVQRECPHCHRALVLAFFEGKTNQDIAGVMKCSDKSVKRYRGRGLQMLREQMALRGVAELATVELDSPA